MKQRQASSPGQSLRGSAGSSTQRPHASEPRSHYSERRRKLDLALVQPSDLDLERDVGHLDLQDAGDELRPARLERRELRAEGRLYRT